MNRPSLLFFMLLIALISTAQGQDSLLILRVQILQVEKGSLTAPVNVLVVGDRIQAIFPDSVQVQGGYEILNGTGKYLMPGLWDMHTHNSLGPQQIFPLLLANGITGIRSMFDPIDSIKSWKQQIRIGRLAGPEIYSSGPIVDGPHPMWPGSVALSAPDQARRAVDSLVDLGIDFVKVYSFMNRETYFAIAEACRSNGIPFAGHIPACITIWEAAAAGQRSSEHGYGIMAASSAQENHLNQVRQGTLIDSALTSYPAQRAFLLHTFSQTKADSVFKALAMTHLALCPTLVVNRMIGNIRDSAFRAQVPTRYVNPFMVMGWQPENDFRLRTADDAYFATERALAQILIGLMGLVEQSGVTVLAGTDYPNPFIVPGFSLHDELQLMVSGGMSPQAALMAATISPVKFLGIDDQVGEVEVGKIANLLLLSENPLEDIRATTSMQALILRGKLHQIEDLQKEIEALAHRFGH